MKILGIDPGTAICGWGLIESDGHEPRILKCGVITTKAKSPDADRLEIIYDSVCDIIKKEKPEAVAVEQLFFFKNQKTVMTVSQTRGAIVLAVQKSRTPLFEYTPLQVKQAVVGYGRAEKNQVQEMVKVILHLKEIPKPDDAADALAIAICCSQSQKNKSRAFGDYFTNIK
ncbi:MAG: crossover junction endodeoxyribonuclease RuvC [Candidatus Berkelbacteria bacterium]|nr:crossover junction endodeoxyribonuclease RuvC [Candidatus Berkelbacteria bacterium]